MKKLVGISSFCDSEEKINVLKFNLLKLKDLEVDTLLFTPIPLPQEIYNLCTEVIISSENPILKWPEYGMTFWKIYPYLSNEIKFTLIKSDYGWASINQLKRWNVKYHKIFFGKPSFDILIDDKSYNFDKKWFKKGNFL